MADCYEGMRAALRRNIEGLDGLTTEQKEALLSSEMSAAIAATESGRPFVEIYGPDVAENDDDSEAETPAETPRPASKIGHAGKK